MSSQWYKNTLFSEPISKEDALRTHGALAHKNSTGKITHCELYTKGKCTYFIYYTTWPAEALIARHQQNHPGIAFRINTPMTSCEGSETLVSYHYNETGHISFIVEASQRQNSDGLLLIEKTYGPNRELRRTLREEHDNDDNVVLVQELAADGKILGEWRD